jgi:gamma-glutamylcyclotransferase
LSQASEKDIMSKTPMNMKYFAYASNLSKKQMLERCPDAKPLSTAVLPNYCLAFVGWSRKWGGAVATIKPKQGQRVRGAIYEITDVCARRIDAHEGETYQRLNVTVFDEDDQSISAFTYIKTGQHEDGQPSKEYLEVIQQGLRDWRLF